MGDFMSELKEAAKNHPYYKALVLAAKEPTKDRAISRLSVDVDKFRGHYDLRFIVYEVNGARA